MKKIIIAISIFTLIVPSFSYAAIAYDNFSKVAAVTTGSSVSWSHKVTSSNSTLVVSASTCSSLDPNFTATYNSASMTLVGKKLGTTAWTYVFEIFNPSTGTNTITLSWSSGSVCWGGIATSYSNATANPPEASSSASAPLQYNITGALTPSSTGDWVVMATRAEAGGTITAGNASTTLRGTGDINESLFDSNSIAAAGSSYSMNAVSTNQGAWGLVIFTLQAYTTPVSSSRRKVMLIN